MTAAVLSTQYSDIFHLPYMKKQPKPKNTALPSIAPRYQSRSDPFASDPLTPASLHLPRPRLPPRSRFGCWTCRTRKVKCDEARPECTPCTRLGHMCDYNPRLSFKDDTSRVIEKASGRGGGVGPVWKLVPGSFKRQRLIPNEKDILPPFSSLTNDEDRERKAELKPVGTYIVVVNPASFVNLEEYRDTLPEDPYPVPSPSYVGPSTNEVRAITQIDSPVGSSNNAEEVNDPDIVVLSVFEDDTRTSLSPIAQNQMSKAGRSSRTGTLSTTSTGTLAHQSDTFRFSLDHTPLMKFAHPDGRDHSIIYYYKNFVHRHLAQVHRDSLGTSLESGALSAPDVFERQAGEFQPLYHALMAFSGLSMAHKNSIPSLDALQHYQQALPLLQASIQSEEDLASDGVFLTHFILLLYEIAAGEPRGISLWGQHISQLQRIIMLRRELYGTEPYSFILWWVASIDVHVILSGMGQGECVEAMLRHRLLPTGIESNNELAPALNLRSPGDGAALPSSLAFHRRICVLAAEIAMLTRDLRNEARRLLPRLPSTSIMNRWQQQIGVLQDTLRRTWNVQMPASVASGYCNQLLPVGARGIFEHTFALYRALIIYSHTSMYPTQRLHHPSHSIHEVSQSAGQILQLGREIVSGGHMERKFIVFPLFMAGFVNRYKAEKEEILGLVMRMEEDSVGRNMIATRQLLEIVYERQERRKGVLREERRSMGLRESEGWDVGEEDVDWVGMIGELGLQVVNCRL